LSVRFFGGMSQPLRPQPCGFVEGCLLFRLICGHCFLILPSLNFFLEKGLGATLVVGTGCCHGR
jgi:hypothetical protein